MADSDPTSLGSGLLQQVGGQCWRDSSHGQGPFTLLLVSNRCHQGAVDAAGVGDTDQRGVGSPLPEPLPEPLKLISRPSWQRFLQPEHQRDNLNDLVRLQP